MRRAFVPRPLPPGSAASHRWPVAREARRRATSLSAGSTASRHCCRTPGAVPLRLRPQGGGALLADRGHAVVAVRPAAVRARRRRPACRSTTSTEVSNYVAALEHGLGAPARAASRSRNRLLREIHGMLLAQRPGQRASSPASSAASQNWIGGTRPGNARFVPPPPARGRRRAWRALERVPARRAELMPAARQGRRWPTSSSRRSTRSSTATAASAGC